MKLERMQEALEAAQKARNAAWEAAKAEECLIAEIKNVDRHKS